MSLASPRAVKALALVVVVLIVLQYTYTTFFESRWIEPLFIFNSSLLGKNHIYVFPGHMINNSDKSNANSSETQVLYDHKGPLPLCPPVPPNLVGPMKVIKDIVPAEDIARLFPDLQPGGQWQPRNCTARDHVAIIVPYRNREAHLYILLRNLHPMLQRQQIDYGIFIIEQAGEGPFNRAMLFNVGFLEALKVRDFDCFIFHDVDLIPEDDRNFYTCPEQPRHMSVAVDVFSYKLPYADLFGGVSAMTREQFEQVNGFSNMFWGWGGEDDDMSSRLRNSGLHISRYPNNIARYTMLTHRKEKANPKRYEKLYNSHKRMSVDGINSIQYKRLSLKFGKLFTWVLVELAGGS
ncbi:beta-1,4-N-acetylgalactosaminyltransferase bre-4-like [Macrosteles quadrilineatus]|uniref:beta-1,4-N-acetylgalactosaminyltransferase bre-4-like n=1 Tax=Macrosteles quadrilineatus TaxID=74068 RepID=UPI0023E1A76C|nr:beta-1,4-N-acetylgalactosaminyltransferase bre-4-like [Macrosteles quadrilineatus]XP_054267668.1 beta-1,4-N-acetylgalactosaminyltransferase bre-4-like [Macrosteles quadrilineatus]XP_054267669.1 beta-1,4-N-acetylgalactosaminyltransferase bre-4-like [Macrosteles quadrilineatus]XP_054268308.1 beta-1,4-N-acetylgalactosaminyltransferase bre-4-like [Macrosteles quadrilineatus]XP_054268309.1 beta-1,4-N-acetylgalactosaminyltransferase bre-4-like [Macrosteles quadrilineatus]XP_054268310.1 beta-1,4-N